MSERIPGYDRGDEGRTRVAARDAAICETVNARHDGDEDTAGWLAALWRALAPAYQRAATRPTVPPQFGQVSD